MCFILVVKKEHKFPTIIILTWQMLDILANWIKIEHIFSIIRINIAMWDQITCFKVSLCRMFCFVLSIHLCVSELVFYCACVCYVASSCMSLICVLCHGLVAWLENKTNSLKWATTLATFCHFLFLTYFTRLMCLCVMFFYGN